MTRSPPPRRDTARVTVYWTSLDMIIAVRDPVTIKDVDAKKSIVRQRSAGISY